MTQSGYSKTLDGFLATDAQSIVSDLKEYISDAGESQIRAWKDSIKILKNVVGQLAGRKEILGQSGSIILEYTIPLESR